MADVNDNEPRSFAQQQPYFTRVADGVFWCDIKRVKVLIDLFKHLKTKNKEEYHKCIV